MVYAETSRVEFLVPEHLLLGVATVSTEFAVLAKAYGFKPEDGFESELYRYVAELDHVADGVEYELCFSNQTCTLLVAAAEMAMNAGRDEVDVPHLLQAMLDLDDSTARYVLERYLVSQHDDMPDEASATAIVMRNIIDAYRGLEVKPVHGAEEEEEPFDFMDDDYDSPFPLDSGLKRGEGEWRRLVTCVSDIWQQHNPLIGREAELDRTIQVLCRCDKNNPLHIGEPGVGKTALVYGLAQRIAEGKVPPRLEGARIYMLDMGTLVAGTSYRGEFEQRIKRIMEGVAAEKNSIVYIDEIHTLVGAGASSEHALDGSNILKPYLESGQIRFIGATTYKEYNRYFQKSQGLVRRFQQIDVTEPTVDETVQILEGLRGRYEEFHGVTYDEGVLEHAVKMSARYITGRFLPDKAIDLIDEAGAFRQTHPQQRRYKGTMQNLKRQTVDKELVNETVRRICKISEQTMEATQTGGERLETLAERMQSQIYGQDEAIRRVTEAVMVGKAGLLDADKPVASMLFVGPTGVGKTEVCRVLANELGLELVRFDMSEYTEKHTVAKLIGSPAGYVGYEDGGLLTDAIRKSPNCVLLLDEIEKAHSDIYNILLQVMDYARLTDNKGQHADFRHVILIMTSNAGAQHASQAMVGFASTETAGTAMLTAVRKTFKPEFIGRLSATVVFNDMTRSMARLVLDKKLAQLSARLAAKHITMYVSDEALNLLLDRGFTQKNGAREIDRTINALLTPLLTREILFGKLKDGGEVTVGVEGEELRLGTK
ncbi:MAG: AAA family ATPase [Bacteroidales bacterium]|nr:AAA family ATPase [Bacteroidales bacterium]